MDIKLKQQASAITDLTFDLLRCCEAKEKLFAKDHGLKVAEFRCLRIIEAGKTYSVQELATNMHLSPSRLTRIIDGLFAEKLVDRVQSIEDRRFAKISLTGKGQTLVGKLKEEYAELHGEMLKDISTDQRDKIYEGISLMGELVSDWLVKNS
ncbi:MarR family transcriptional regulator [bacterium]|nr:MarR family transcriptional regulator [bacterium]